MDRTSTTQNTTPRRRWQVMFAVVAAAVVIGAVVSAPSLIATSRADAATAVDCSAGRVMTLVAHADDDLLFEGTELRTEISAGKCVRSVVVTAGDAGKNATYWKGRQTGLEAAYANLAGVQNAWTSTATSAGGKTVLTRTLTAAPRLSLVFLQLPDGNMDGSGFAATRYQSLQKLYQGSISSISTVTGASYATTYTLAQLKATMLALMQAYGPQEVHTLDHVGTYGDGDHSDHHTVAYIAAALQKQLATTSTLTGYMGYPIASRPSNLTAAQTDVKGRNFFVYSAYDQETCASVAACSSRPEGSWLSREYTVGSTPSNPGTGTGGGTNPEPGTGGSAVGADVTAGVTVTASSDNPADGQTAAKAVDGVASGYPAAATAEWATRGGTTGSWLQLTWPSAVTVGAIDLADRPNADDQVTAGTLTFSDGSKVAVPTLDNGGAYTRVTFSAKQTTSVRFTVTGVSSTTRNVGLAEIRAFAPASSTPTPTPTPTPGTATDVTASATASAAWDDASSGQTAAKAIDGVVSGYPDNPSAEWVAPYGTTGVWLQLDWASAKNLGRVVLYDRPNSDDQVTSGTLTFSDGSQVAVGTLPNAGTAQTVDFSARSVTWVRFTVTGVSGSTRNVGLSEFRAFAS